jgi:hypothetical protein
MKWPWVSREQHEEMKALLLAANHSLQTNYDKLLDALVQTDGDPDDIEILPIPDLPEVIEKAMFQRAAPQTYTWDQLRSYALDEMRKDKSPEDIANQILEGGSL